MFTSLEQRHIAEIKSTATRYRHDPTGAELISVENDDENKVFGITFRTPPNDSTGVAHILEHSVLCGSRRYPVKEPFVELLKGSLQTFLNAFTFPDKTCYPVASQNPQDFYNLINVYMDAVLYPLLTPHTHAQEAWHYEIEKPKDPLIFKGVVFNEMKGVYSSPDSALAQYGQETLFPDITYGLDSGGRPSIIPDLTFEQLLAFHQRYYHPSNARIWFYGNDNPARRRELMEEWLKPFARIEIDSSVPLQRRIEKPREVIRLYQGDAEAKAMLVVNWLLCETTNVVTSLGLEILSHILIGTPAAPLRKVLIESGLGEDVAGIGLESQLRQMYFSTGLKGVKVSSVGKIAPLIFQALEKLAKQGLDPKTVEASLNTMEFRLRENNTGHFPRGIALMVRSLGTWNYGGDPFAPLLFEKPLGEIKARAGQRYFEDLIQRFLLANQHRATLLLKPDAHVSEKEEAAERERLAQARSRLNEKDIAALIEETRVLKQRQIEKDPPEELAKIPRLGLSDLPRKNTSIPCEESSLAGGRVLFHDLFTNGIVYFDLGFDLSVLPVRLLPYTQLFGQALLEMGTDAEDFVALDQRIGRTTGGIEPDLLLSTKRDGKSTASWLFLRGKAMLPKAQGFLEILGDVLTRARLDDRERFRQIVLEEKADIEADLIPSGHSFVNTRLRASLTAADWLDDQTDGISYIFFLRKLAQRIEKDWPSVLRDLDEIRDRLIHRGNSICNVTTDAPTWGQFQPLLEGFLNTLRNDAPAADAWPLDAPEMRSEGLAVPSAVNYVGLAASLFDNGYKLHGSSLVISRFLRNAYLWERVRVQGGAYGGMCMFDNRSGVMSFVSYRDPNVEKTLAIYRAAGEYLRSLELNDDELTKSIVGAIGDLDQYQLPDAKGYTSLMRRLVDDTDDYRQHMRDEVLATSLKDFRAFGDVLRSALDDRAAVVVLGSAETLKRAGLGVVHKVMG